MFLHGHYYKSKKVSGPQILEQFDAIFLDIPDVPTAYHIKNHVQTVLAALEEAEHDLKIGLTEVHGRRSQGVPDDYAEATNRIVRQDPCIKTAVGSGHFDRANGNQI